MTAPPASDAPPPPGEPSGGTTHPDPHRDDREFTSRLSQAPEDERRCAHHRPCVEVTARLIAADKADRVFHDVDAARQLRETARRYAEQHRYGTHDEDR